MPGQTLQAELGQGRQTDAVPYESESQFRRLLEKLPAGAYTCDSGGLITYFNQHAADLWGRAPKLNDPVDRFCGSFRLFTTEGTPLTHDQCWMAKALRLNREYNGHEIVIERPDGQRLTALAHANPIRDDFGQLLGAVNVLVDISDRKRAEDALKEADRSKNEFLAMLAHELRNPLAPIRNAVGVLYVKAPRSPELTEALQVIDRQMRHMTRLIDDLLDIARIAHNRLELRPERVELADVVRTAVETTRPLIEAQDQELVVALPASPLTLDADPTRLAQALANLLNNAAKYTDRGGHIRLDVEQRGGEAVLTVRDSGIGIPATMLPRIFEMFTQGQQAQGRPNGGLGVGLALVQRLVEMHGGTITARSEGCGQGSEFTVRLPLVEHGGEGVAEKGGQRAERADPTPRPTGSRILIVDDNADSAASLAMLLRMTGHDIRTAHDGLAAVSAAEEFRPDVILLDLGLPRLSGHDAARQIRQQPWGRDTVLIAVTGWGQEADRARSHAAGFSYHLVKPVAPGELIDLLASLKRASGP